MAGVKRKLSRKNTENQIVGPSKELPTEDLPTLRDVSAKALWIKENSIEVATILQLKCWDSKWCHQFYIAVKECTLYQNCIKTFPFTISLLKNGTNLSNFAELQARGVKTESTLKVNWTNYLILLKVNVIF